MTPDELRQRNARYQRAWRARHPDLDRLYQTRKPSYPSTTGESLGFGRPMTRREVGLFSRVGPAAVLAHTHARPLDQDEQTVSLLLATDHRGDPRTYLRDCQGCGLPFWCRPPGTQRHCSQRCRARAYYRRHHPLEEDR